MGEEYPPSPVKLFIGILYKDRKFFEEIKETLISEFGEMDFESEEIQFRWTNYYEDEIGPNLKRVFVSFTPLISPEHIVEIKQLTNRIEGKNRRINLDPGYLEGGKLVLATTKDQAHRVYLNKGIYAEVTLRFKEGKFIPFDYTYPDYRSEEYHNIFYKIRRKYFEDLKKPFLLTSRFTTKWALKSLIDGNPKTKGILVIRKRRDIIEMIELIQKARGMVDILALAVGGDREMALALSHIDYVDYVFSFRGKVDEVAHFLKPDVLFLADEITLDELGFYEGRVLRL
ncbi:MAG: DUF4416 family protein [Synergistetes bacterium]|nr:DUF4416 family protein [Synergistota bacterium]MCX8127836.1 DUF4416 family protein [Synergistota bacterium]MDW8192098.1 DUF4416 family protein [Synergistota bacterium]